MFDRWSVRDPDRFGRTISGCIADFCSVRRHKSFGVAELRPNFPNSDFVHHARTIERTLSHSDQRLD